MIKQLKLKPLQLGKHTIENPVVLAPMAGITNAPFRTLCKEYGGGLYVAEMVTSRALVERKPESFRIISHDANEKFRSVQLYGVEPKTVEAAVRLLVEEDRADHIDLNFGCPVPKVTRKGGGAALPWKIDLFKEIVNRAVVAADEGNIPLTIKMRKGIDDDHLTFIDAGKIARDAGVAAVALHGRTASQYYSGQADWDAIAELRGALPDIPVLGNGDIFSAEDAIEMVEQTGIDGVVIGRGCQGRPWLFGDLQAAFEGNDERNKPGLRKVTETAYRHAELLTEFFGDEFVGLRDLRKHMSWYFKGYAVGGDTRRRLSSVDSLEQLQEIFDSIDLDAPYPGKDAEGRRGRSGNPKRTKLPYGWLDSCKLNEDQQAMIKHAEYDTSGG
ncbi:MAG: tRNA dihydrouridine synthase DusB [Micrococcaceae bacterium]